MHRQGGFFEPEVEMIQAAALDLDDDFVRRGLRFGQITKFKFPRLAVGDELGGLHVRSLTQRRKDAKAQKK